MAMSPIRKKTEKRPNIIKQFDYIYSPRTVYSNKLDEENRLFTDLSIGFDPITIKIIKKHFKERLGMLSENDFIGILKNHLLSWHPELPNREKVLVKLLAKLFNAIDLNNNGTMEWDEFTNYIISSSNEATIDDLSYRLRYYFPAKETIDESDYTEVVSFSFYIEKYNIIGVVLDGKSQIMFYDGNTCRKLKTLIEVKETQKEIDELEVKELNMKAVELIKLEEEEKRKKKHKQERKGIDDSLNKVLVTETCKTERNQHGKYSLLTELKNKNTKKYDREETPEKLKKEINRIKQEPQLYLKKELNKKLTVLTVLFIPEYDTLLVSCTNNKISAWKYINGEFKNINTSNDRIIDHDTFQCSILTTDVPQYTLAWDPIQKCLYSGQADGKILKWTLTQSRNLENETFDVNKANIRKDKEKKGMMTTSQSIKGLSKTMNKDKSEKNISKDKAILKPEYHKRDSVSCIVILGKLQLLAGGYYNGNIILWDIVLKDYRKFYCDQDTGVYQIVYDSTKNLIFSCGFDHNIFIYDPYIDGSSIYKLVGHNWSINSISLNEKDSELVSLDILGNIKIWDTKTFHNFQTINLNENYNDKGLTQSETNKNKKKISSNLHMLYLTKIKKILVYGEKLFLFETDRATNPDLADDQLVFGCYYQPGSYELVTVCLKKIKIWGIMTGKVKKIYDDPMKNEITTFTFDESQKRIYIGDNFGKIKNFNMSNGNFIKDFSAHATEIVYIAHSTKHNMLITSSSDQIIRVHSDKELMTTGVLKELSFNAGFVKTIHILDDLNRVVFGLSTGTTKFYDIDHFRFDSESMNEGEKLFVGDEISCIKEIYGTELILIGHESGRARLLIVPPSGLKYTSIAMFNNTIVKDDITQAGIFLAIDYDKERKLLFTGDQFGFIKCFSIEKIVNIIMKDEDHKITINNIYEIEKCKIEEIWCVYAHRESIKHIHYPLLSPRVIISTGNDLRVKIINAENGQFIDELRQISSKSQPVPIGIKYFITDPLQSKRPKDQEDESNIIWRKDIEKNPANLIRKYTHLPKINAKDNLWQLTKGANIKENRSNPWQYQIDFDFFLNYEEKKFDEIYSLIKAKEEEIKRTELLMQHNSIFNENYRPLFIEDMNEEKMKEFSMILSNKLRSIKLSMAKISVNQQKYQDFQKEEKAKENKMNELAKSQVVSLRKKTLQPLIISSNHNKTKELNTSTNVTRNKVYKSQYAYLPPKNISTNENFEQYKEDFNKRLQEVIAPIDELRKRRKPILPKICQTEESQ